MKTMKRIAALALALMLVLGMAVPAFAAGADHQHVITIHNDHTGYTYKAYQIFAGDLGADGVLSNISWGAGVDGDALLAELKTLDAYADCTNAKQVAAVLANAPKAMDDPAAVAFAEIAAKNVKGDGVESSYNDAAKYYEIGGLVDGYYLVVNTAVPDATNTTVSRYILEVVRDIAVTHKGTYPTVDKNVVEAEVKLKQNQSPIGADVTFEITSTMPSTIDTYLTYFYAFHDTLSKGLTYSNNMTVTVNGVDVTEYFYVEIGEYNEETGTNVYIAIQDILALELLENENGEKVVGDINKDTKVVVTYTATVNENAVIAGEGNPNVVYLEYDNNPNTEGVPTPPTPNPDKPTPPDPTGKTPEVETVTYVTELAILKKDGAGNILTGAEFTLTGTGIKTVIVTRETFAPAAEGETAIYWELNDGTFTDVAPVFDNPDTPDVNEDTSHAYKNPGTADAPAAATHVIKEVEEIIETAENVEVKAFVGEDGKVTFTGLGAGTYTLTESVTPSGYNTIDPITFEITFNPTTGKFDCASNWIMVEADNTLYAEIINVAGTTLPSTGGIGTTMFYVIGGIMFFGAVLLLVTKKRMSA